MKQMMGFVLCLTLAWSSAFAIMNETNQDRWSKPCTTGPDAEVPGFLVNLGPTGARGILKSRSFVVKYVFRKSPASGILEIGDEITAANGKPFSAHTFSGDSQTGFDGPILDMGLAIEKSEGGDGKLALSIVRGGAKKTVTVQLEKLGTFSSTFPVNCKKTEILKKRAYDYLMKNHDDLQSQGRCVLILSMLSSDNSRVRSYGKKLAKEWNTVPGPDTWTWHLTFQAITLAEYYLATKDRSVYKTLETVVEMIRTAQYQGDNIQVWKPHGGADAATMREHQDRYVGGFGHAPFNRDGMPEAGSIRLRNGYGPMQRPTYLAIIAYQLAQQCGITLNHNGLETAFQFVDYGTNSVGNTAYGGEFTLNNGPVDSKEWKTGRNYGNSHRSGMAYLLYMLSPERKESKKMMSLHLNNIDESYKDMQDGHACPMLGLTWGWVGVFASNDKSLKKKVFEYQKAWLNMARCHGSDSYVILPGRNYADESYYNGNIRNHTTASVAMLYSFSSPALRVQGVASPTTGGRSFGRTAATPARRPRTLAPGNAVKLTEILQNTLLALHKRKPIESGPMQISRFREEAFFATVTTEGVSFKDSKGAVSKAYKLDELSSKDRAALAALAAEIESNSGDVQALAGVFKECAGQLEAADEYYEKAGADSVTKFEALFR